MDKYSEIKSCLKIEGINPVTENDIFKKRELQFYIHIPFCKNVCTSCPYVKKVPTRESIDEYLLYLKKEISLYANTPYVKDSIFTGGYFGGGTPTALDEDQFLDLLNHLRSEFNYADDIELSVETTPLDITESKAKMLFVNGVDRISMGVQSFYDNELKNIGRNYTSEKVVDSLNVLKKIGYKKINIDLMYGLPGQTLESWESSVQQAINLNINSIAFYSYIFIETPKAILKRIHDKLPEMASNEVRKEMFDRAAAILTQNGYHGFLSDAFVKEGYEAAYAVGPWKNHSNIIGLGVTAIGNLNNSWYVNVPSIDVYGKMVSEGKFPYSIGKKISKKNELHRSVIMGIKFCVINRHDYEEYYGVDFVDLFQDQIKVLLERELIEITDDKVIVTEPKGWYYLDNISKEFYEEEFKRYPQPVDDKILRLMEEEAAAMSESAN